MEELLYKLEVIILIRKAISQAYNSINASNKRIECISLIDDIEEKVVTEYSNKERALYKVDPMSRTL